jgi:hypothetical protein
VPEEEGAPEGDADPVVEADVVGVALDVADGDGPASIRRIVAMLMPLYVIFERVDELKMKVVPSSLPSFTPNAPTPRNR